MTGTADSTFDFIDDPTHSLLERPSRAYTNVTVRRAFIVWMYCGQKNNFQHVCNYYHHLEEMEDKLPPHERAMSRHHEFDIFTNQPPTSKYLNQNFPNLYSDKHVDPTYIQRIESIKNEKCIFKLEGFQEFLERTDVSSKEIEDASNIIRKYCSTQMIPLRRFLTEFKEYADKCKLNYTVSTVVKYIKRKMLQAEIDVINNTPKSFDFLETAIDSFKEIDNIKEFDNFKEFGNFKEFDNFKENDNFKEIDNVREIFKPKLRKLKNGFSAKDIKLNPTCAAFFNSFNARYFENKCVSLSPLVISNNSSSYNVSNNKTKSQSVESLFKNFSTKYQDSNFFKSSLFNIDEIAKLRKI